MQNQIEVTPNQCHNTQVHTLCFFDSSARSEDLILSSTAACCDWRLCCWRAWNVQHTCNIPPSIYDLHTCMMWPSPLQHMTFTLATYDLHTCIWPFIMRLLIYSCKFRTIFLSQALEFRYIFLILNVRCHQKLKNNSKENKQHLSGYKSYY